MCSGLPILGNLELIKKIKRTTSQQDVIETLLVEHNKESVSKEATTPTVVPEEASESVMVESVSEEATTPTVVPKEASTPTSVMLTESVCVDADYGLGVFALALEASLEMSASKVSVFLPS